MAIVAAHEVGHHVQEQLGVLEAMRAGEYTNLQAELQADCFAGAWGYSVYELIEEGDIEEAMNISWHTGDPPQLPAGHPGAHGSPEERVQAFENGFLRDPTDCLDYTPVP